MKHIFNIKSWLMVFFVFALLTSCDKFLDVNDNPNSPIEVGPNLILSNSQLGFAYELSGGPLHLMTGAFVQHYAGTGNQLASYDIYSITGESMDNTWLFSGYSGFLNHSKDLINQASGDPVNVHYLGIGKILNAFQFLVFTDVFGDIPYSQALDRENFKNPVFDSQQSIYAALVTQIEDGLADLDNPTAGAVSGDLIYGGDVELWKKAGNTLLLKLYLQMRKADPSTAESGFNEVLSRNNAIANISEDMELQFFAEETNQHPLFDFAINNRPGDIAISQRFLDSLNAVNDPRIGFYFVDQGSGLLGFENGSNAAAPPTGSRALLGQYVIGYNGNGNNAGGDAPYRFLTSFQTYFSRAEAALFLNTGEDARDMFRLGIEHSMNKVGVGLTDANTYLADRLNAYDAASTDEERLQVIMRDKWQAMIGNPYESWNDYRRTGYPELDLAQNAVGISDIPGSLPYGANELTANSSAPPQKLLSAKVWWDVD